MQKEPELIIDKNGNKFWYLNRKSHREDGPAIEFSNGDKFWCLNGVLHRADGPAIELSNGEKLWHLNGDEYSFEEWLKLAPLSDQEKLKLRLQHAE